MFLDLFKFWISKLVLNFTIVWLLLTAYQVIQFGTTNADYVYAVLWGAITAVLVASFSTFSAYRIRCKKVFSEEEQA